MTAHPTSGPSRAALDAALVLLSQLGISPTDLTNAAPARPPAPTFAEYVPVVSAAVTAGTRRVYGSYWNRITEHWGQRRLTNRRRPRSSPSSSRSAATSSSGVTPVAAAAPPNTSSPPCAASTATRSTTGTSMPPINPARKVDKPRRLPSTRRAVADTRLAEINHIAATTGDDPALDSPILRLHIETACRRGGALALLPADLDPDQCLILLHEKGETVRWQPVSPTLMSHLQRHLAERPAQQMAARVGAPTPVLRYRNGRPITRRRYDHLWTRIGSHLPWVATQQISTRWLRHTTLTWVERSFGYGVARAYAGHTDSGGDAGPTTTYVGASVHEVATALAALTERTAPARMTTDHTRHPAALPAMGCGDADGGEPTRNGAPGTMTAPSIHVFGVVRPAP
jgi:integrase/recombinase XerC